MLAWALNLGFAASASDAPVVVTPDAVVAGGGPRGKKRRIIVDGRHYLADKEEEAAILRAYVEKLEDDKKEVQKELVHARKLNKATKQKPSVQDGNVYVTRMEDVARIDLAPILREIKEIERQRKEAIRKYERIMAEIEDEEVSIALLLSLGM